MEREGGFLIAKIKQTAERIFDRKLKLHGIDNLSHAQGRIMFVLWQNDGISIQSIARQTQLGKSTLTSMLDTLEQEGFICRKASPKDRRQTLVWRTDKDKSMQKKYLRVSEEMTDLFYGSLTDGEITRFEKTLQIILDNLIRHERHKEDAHV